MHRYKVDTIPHIICGGFSKEETENALLELHYLGVENVLLLRGDAMKSERYFTAEKDGNKYASELVAQVVNLNKGRYLDREYVDGNTDFCIGVAGYPEKHFEAPNFDMDMSFLRQKVDAGADYIVTQMFFDNSRYFHFVEQCRASGIDVPIIPGIKPLSTVRQINVLPQMFHIDIPQDLAIEAKKCKDNSQVMQLGIEWSIKQCKELKGKGVPVLHFYSMGKASNIRSIVSQVF